MDSESQAVGAVTFVPGDHERADRYVVAIYPAGSDTRTADPVATVDIGKPSIADDGRCHADIAATFRGLPPGTYTATVVPCLIASEPSPPFRRSHHTERS